MEEFSSTTQAGLDDVVTVTELYNVFESSSVSSTTELLTKITESITELVSAIPEITTESSESTTHSNFPADLHFSPFDYAIFGIMLAMSGINVVKIIEFILMDLNSTSSSNRSLFWIYFQKKTK